MHWDLWNIVVVAVICIVTMAVVKRITLRAIVRTAIKVMVWPFTRLTRKAIKEAEVAWKEEEAQDKAGDDIIMGRK